MGTQSGKLTHQLAEECRKNGHSNLTLHMSNNVPLFRACAIYSRSFKIFFFSRFDKWNCRLQKLTSISRSFSPGYSIFSSWLIFCVIVRSLSSNWSPIDVFCIRAFEKLSFFTSSLSIASFTSNKLSLSAVISFSRYLDLFNAFVAVLFQKVIVTERYSYLRFTLLHVNLQVTWCLFFHCIRAQSWCWEHFGRWIENDYFQ